MWNTAIHKTHLEVVVADTGFLLTPLLSCATERLASLEHSTSAIVTLIPAQHYEVASNATSISFYKRGHTGRSDVRRL